MNSENPSPNKKKKAKKTFNLNRFLKSIIILLLVIIFIGSGLVLGTAYAWIKSAKPLNVAEVFNLNQTTYIVDKNDKVIDKLHANENRTMVTLDKIPMNLQNAFIAIEDKRFYKHNGIDIYRILGSLKEDLKTGSMAQGGSTITQQLIKNIYLTRDKVIKRKVIEIYYALQLERQFTKKQILEAYLNTLGMGHNVAGVKEAALYYYGKEMDQLDLAECAMLAGITNNPSMYSPYINYENSNKRKNLILGEMLSQGMISQEDYDRALNEKVTLNKVEREVETTYFADMIIKDVTDTLHDKLGYSKEEAERKLFNGGLKIVATIDTEMQDAVEEAFKNPKYFPTSKEDANGNLQPEAAMIILDNSTGEIKAIMGGRSSKVRRGLNRATQSIRQPGSTIKPLSVYTPALDNGYTVSTVLDDVPSTFGKYKPNNSDDNFHGLTTIRDAIRRSVNLIAVKIVQDIGVERSADYLKKFHLTTIETENRKYNDKNLAALALGGLTHGVKPIEMAAAYSVFPNKGIYIKPISFTKILDNDGNVIYENKPEKDRVISAQVAYLMVDIMKGVVTGGTGTGAALSNMPVAGKTGTTSKAKDLWFIGYTPYYTAAVWMGHDEPKIIPGTYGATYCAPLWKTVMEQVHKNLPYKDFERPDGLISVDICTVSGKRPTQLCALDPRGSTVRSELFIRGTEPSAESVCDVHVIKDIDTSTGLLATPYCPTPLIQSKVFIQRIVPFVPDPNLKDKKGNPIVPDDYIYEAPVKTCDVHGPGDGTQPPTEGDGTTPTTDVTPTPPVDTITPTVP